MTSGEKIVRLAEHIDEVIQNLWTHADQDRDIFPITSDQLHAIAVYRYMDTKDNPCYGSDPTPMFNEAGEFMTDNWASGQSLIRAFFEFYQLSTVIENHDPEAYFTHILTYYEYHEDQHYVQITLLNDSDATECCDQYFITWYKSRGRTERIYKNGRPIRLAEYVELCNIFFGAIKNNGGDNR